MQIGTRNLPASLHDHGPGSKPSIQRPTRQQIKKEKNQKGDQENQPNHTMAPTFDIPFGSNKTSAKRTSPAVSPVSVEVSYKDGFHPHTLSHEIFEMMPFDIIGQVADVDSAVLLRGFADGLHHLLFRSGSIFE